MPKILILDGLSEEGVKVFRDAGFETDVRGPLKGDELAQALADADGLVVRSATKVTAEAMQAGKKLKVVGRAGAGTDNIDKNAATELGIVVMNTPGGNTISTCEHTFAMMFALCRNIPAAHQSMQEGRWDRKKFMGTELHNKTIGIIGVGRIGGEVARRARAFEMRILAYDPILTQMKAEALGIELVPLETLLEQADFITVHAPKSEATNNMIAAPQLARMKPSCRIVNCARGGIVNEQDLAAALREHRIAGAALDVFTSEPFENNPFIGLDNIVMTPHLAASTDEAQLNVAIEIAHQMVDYLENGAVVNAVNVPSLDTETREKLQPLLYLADRLGQFQSYYTEGPPTEIEIEYSGDLGTADSYPVTTAILCGYLKRMVNNVNMVNAPSQLKSRGIRSSEVHSGVSSDYAFEIGVTVKKGGESHSVKGTLFNGNDPRICCIDGTRVDAQPEGDMLVCNNEDKPLILGRMCTRLGDAGINIANLTLGRDSRGGRALTVLNLDQAVPDDVLEDIRKIPHINSAKRVVLSK